MQNMAQTQQQKQGQNTTNIMSQNQQNPFIHTIDLNKNGYLYEKFDLELSKVLSCSNTPEIRNNLVWNEA